MKVLKLIFKNSFRHKLRTFLTIVGISIAVMAFGMLRTVYTAWHAGLDMTSPNRLVTRQAVSFIFPLPYAYREQILKISGVQTATFANWFQGVYKDKNQFFARMSVDADTYFEVYPEFIVQPQQFMEFKKERNACIVGADIAATYGFKVGDIINITGDIYPGDWSFVVRAIYQPRDKTVDGTQMLFHWTYLDERMKAETPGRAGQVGWYVVKISDPDQAAAISQQIDALFANSRAETKTETERAFQQGFLSATGTIITAMNFISFVIIGIIMLVLGNTMIMSARERTREYAVLKTLGFSGGHLVGLIGGESLLISFVGAGLGVAMTFPLVAAFATFIPKGIFPVFLIEPITLILATVAAISVGVAASIFPIQRALGTRIVDGLRHIG
ncbi:MAG: ABC transporter ATP-binding protein [Ignavibacteria bacterium GWA2_55_11]|nr:MAG: ABC transporter ATP-binding protein [Ignavibacteria bacterium GWA2_55_11]OGU43772.1 MAG: ABC transporter ATP-binding protein [Ignavibacteria bacterium GWC2_56_12]OGU66565.1 MAG: ABC transporter ATP-binding protein [Ignavibacteria bacterium RIFCSPHIGHO2_02_FULL_56_12]